MAERFFRGQALAGALHLVDFRDWESWDPAKVAYRDEAEANWLKRMGGHEHLMIRTPTELDEALRDSVSARIFHLYVAESLIEHAKARWEEMKQRPRLRR
jgi:hypothetical protein